MADDTSRLRNDLDYLERQKAQEYAPLGVGLGGPPTAGFPMLPNGQPAPYPNDVQFGVPPTAAFPNAPPPEPAAPYGVGMSAGGMGAIGSPQAPMDLDQGVTPEMAHQAAGKVLPNGSPAPFFVDDGGGQPEIGPMGQALQGYTPPVQPVAAGAAPVMPGWYSPPPGPPLQSADAYMAQSQQGIDPWFHSLTPEEQQMVGGPEAARPRGGPIQGGGGVDPFAGNGMENEIQRIRQQYEQAVRGNYR